MPAFEINGLHVVNGEILPVQYQLQDPNRNQAQADSAFIVRCNNAKIFYYYKQIDKLWIRACLSLGEAAKANLQFSHLIFRADYTTALGMDPALVKKLIKPEQKTDIKNKLISAAAEYKTIEERKAAEALKAAEELKTIGELETVQPPITAPIIPVVEEEYTGKLSSDDRRTLKTLFITADPGKPQKPSDYEGTDEAWDDAWNKALAVMLSTHERQFEKKIPANTHPDIKDALKFMHQFMNPSRINDFRFDRSADEDITEKPMIGHVFDDIQQYFYKMLKDPTLCPQDKLTKISPKFYSIRVGKLNDGTAMVYTGLSDAQSALAIDLYKDYMRFERFLLPESPLAEFKVLSKAEYSIQMMEHIVTLFTDNVIRTEADDQILDDFLAMASATSSATVPGEFADRYHDYKTIVCNKLNYKIKLCQRLKQALLKSQDPGVYIHHTDLSTANSPLAKIIIVSLTQDEMRRLCKFSGFVSKYTLKYIIQVIPMAELASSLPMLITNRNALIEVLSSLPEESSLKLIGLLSVDYLKSIIISSQGLVKVISGRPQTSAIALLKALGQAWIENVIPAVSALVYVIGNCPEDSGLTLLATLGQENLRKLITTASELGKVLQAMRASQWPTLVTLLGTDHIKDLIKDGTAFNATSDHIHAYGDRQVFVRNLMSSLGADLIKHSIKTPDDLGTVLKNLREDTGAKLIDVLGVDHLVKITTTASQLIDFLSGISALSKAAFVNLFGVDRIQTMIKDGDRLLTILELLPEDSRLPLITAMGGIRVMALISDKATCFKTTDYMYREVINTIPLASWPAVTALIGSDNIKTALRGSVGLRDMYSYFENCRTDGNALDAVKLAVGLDLIKDVIFSAEALGFMFEWRDDDARVKLIEMLGADHIIKIIQTEADLKKLLTNKKKSSTALIVGLLGVDRIQGLITDFWVLNSLLESLSEALQLSLLTQIGAVRLRELIPYEYRLNNLLRSIDSSTYATVISLLGSDHLKAIFEDGVTLNALLADLGDAKSIALLAALRDAKLLSHITMKCADINKLLESMDEASRVMAINSLGADLIQSMIKDIDDFSMILKVLPKICRRGFIFALGTAQLRTLVTSQTLLRKLLTCSLSPSEQGTVVQKLERDHTQGIIRDKDDLAAVLSALTKDADKLSFIVMVKNTISDAEALRMVLGHLSEDSSKQALIEMLKPEILSGLIKNRAQLKFVQGGLGIGSKNTLDQILSTLSSDGLRAIMGHDGIGYAKPKELARSLCSRVTIDRAGMKIGGTNVYWPPEALMLTELEKLDNDTLRTSVSTEEKLGCVFANTSSSAWPTLISMLGTNHIKFMIKNAENMNQVLINTDNESRRLSLIDALKTALGDKDMKAILSDVDQLGAVLLRFTTESRAKLINILGPDLLADIIGNSSQLGTILLYLDDDSKALLITTLGPVRLKAMINNGEELSKFIFLFEQPERNNFIAMLGPHILDIIDRGPAPSYYGSELQINRAYKYHSHYHMKKPFDADAINTNIESIFSEMAFPHRYGLPFLVNPSAGIATEIINRCKEGPSPGELLSFLELKLNTVPTDGELAMRIMYCIEQLRYHTHRSVLYAAQEKHWKDIIFPGGASAGLATAIGIGLALAFTPGLHLMIGAIIGVTLVAALITMAVYTIAVHELGAKKDFTDKGLFTSWSVFNKADAPKHGDVEFKGKPVVPAKGLAPPSRDPVAGPLIWR